MKKPLVAGLLALFSTGCESRTVALQSVEGAPSETSARSITLTAQSVQKYRGIGQWSIRHTRAVGARGTATHEMWVVPIVDPGEELGESVSAWVTPPQNHPAGADPEEWFARLTAGFDNQRVTLKVAARAQEAKENESGWGRAIQDAEERYGLRSDPQAPVLFFPSP